MENSDENKPVWLQINFKLINEDLFDLYTEDKKEK